MPKKKNKNKKSIINTIMDNKENEINQSISFNDIKQTIIVPMISHPVGSCVSKIDYDLLCKEYHRLQKERDDLNKELLRITNGDLKKLNSDNEELHKENIDLKERIKYLEKENNELKEKITKHEKTITKLNINVEILTNRLDKKDKEEKETFEKFISAEICVEYEQLILKNLFTKEDLKNNKYTLNNLINLTKDKKINDLKLSSIQTDKWNQYYKELEDNKLLNINLYIAKIKDGRNKSAHEKYKPSYYTFDEAKNHIFSYIETLDIKEETKMGYKKVGNFLISKIEKKFRKNKSMEIEN
jgi:uncharacterized coiled-coil protein SlyX